MSLGTLLILRFFDHKTSVDHLAVAGREDSTGSIKYTCLMEDGEAVGAAVDLGVGDVGIPCRLAEEGGGVDVEDVGDGLGLAVGQVGGRDAVGGVFVVWVGGPSGGLAVVGGGGHGGFAPSGFGELVDVATKGQQQKGGQCPV